MKRGVLLSLILMIVFAAALGGYLTSKDAAVSEFQQKKLFSLKPVIDLNNVTKIEIYGANNETIVKANKVLQQWQLPQHHDYLADEASLSELLSSINASQIVESKTKLKKYHARLGLSDITEAESQAKLLVIEEGQKSFAVLLGNEAENSSGQFVRLQGDDQTYLIDRSITLPNKSSDWIKSAIIDADYQQVRSLKLTKVGEEVYQLLRLKQPTSESLETQSLPLADEQQDTLAPHFEFAEQATEQELMYPGILDGLVRNVLGLSPQAVLLANQAEVDERLILIELDYEGQNDSLVYQVLEVVSLSQHEGFYINDVSGDYWLQLTEFDFKQINKSKDEFFEQEAE